MMGVQCYELFRGIALKNHAFFTANAGNGIIGVKKLHYTCIMDKVS